MLKFIEAINNTVKLITSIATLGILGAVIFGGLKAYHTIAELTSKPIQMPTVELPTIKLPEVKVSMPDFGVVEGFKKFDRELGRAVDNLTKPKEEEGPPGQWGFITEEDIIAGREAEFRRCSHTP